MYQKTYYIAKSSDLFADTLAAYGLAYILEKIVKHNNQNGEVWLRDKKSYYAVELNQPIREDWIKNCLYFTTRPLIVYTDKENRKLPSASPPMVFIDYSDEIDRMRLYGKHLNTLKNLSKEEQQLAQISDIQRQIDSYKPMPTWSLYEQIYKFSATFAYNTTVENWYEGKTCFTEQLELLLQIFSTPVNDTETAQKTYKNLNKDYDLGIKKEKVTTTQTFNPAKAQGNNQAKANNLNSQKTLEEFWLFEHLKIIGLFEAGIHLEQKPDKKKPRRDQKLDRRSYVLLPDNVNLSINRKILRQFREVIKPDRSVVKMDILATLRLTAVFLKQWKAGQRSVHTQFSEHSGHPTAYISGFATVFYKHMGKSHAVLNQSTISLPDWVGSIEPGSEGMAQASLFLKIVNEHEKVIRPLEENRSLEYELLRAYRDFLSSGRLADFFEFTGKYSSYLTQKFEQKELYPPKRFETKYLEVLVMSRNKKLEPIVKNEGFLRIATAIRQSTVQAQYFRHQKNDKRYEIRYGLGQDLIRKGKYPHEFIKALTEFMAKYSNENAMVEEQTARQHGGAIPPEVRRTLRPTINKTDINEIVKLIDDYDGDSELICNLLVAYGYASDYAKKQEKSDAS